MTQINADDATPKVAIVNHSRHQRLLEAERELLRTRLRQASEAAAARAARLPALIQFRLSRRPKPLKPLAAQPFP